MGPPFTVSKVENPHRKAARESKSIAKPEKETERDERRNADFFFSFFITALARLTRIPPLEHVQ
jgi:hypothetical protein